MAIRDIFSKRGKPLPDVYQYTDLPAKLRAQIVHLLEGAIDERYGCEYSSFGPGESIWHEIERTVAAEHGVLNLPRGKFGTDEPYTACLNYVLQAPTEETLDLVEICFRVIDGGVRRDVSRNTVRPRIVPDVAIAHLNVRFRENAVGYQYEHGQIIRVDSQVLHADVVKPALTLLSAKGFQGPNDEFMSAHEHFRHGRIEEAITDACKAFESTMKAICVARKWTYDPKAAAGALIKTLIDNKLVSEYSKEQLENVSKCLIGIATIRNKNAGHGAGAAVRNVAEHYAAYALHLAASNIVFLVECHNALK